MRPVFSEIGLWKFCELHIESCSAHDDVTLNSPQILYYPKRSTDGELRVNNVNESLGNLKLIFFFFQQSDQAKGKTYFQNSCGDIVHLVYGLISAWKDRDSSDSKQHTALDLHVSRAP